MTEKNSGHRGLGIDRAMDMVAGGTNDEIEKETGKGKGTVVHWLIGNLNCPGGTDMVD